MQTEEEMEFRRKKDVEEALEFLHGKELSDRIVAINKYVALWKERHPELVKSECPF